MNETSDRLANPNKFAAGEPISKASRERTWEECGIEEKVERIRQQLRMFRDMQQYTARNASAARELAERHQHGVGGEVLMPAQRRGEGAEAGGSKFDPLR